MSFVISIRQMNTLDNLHGSALYCGGSDRSLSFADRTRSGIAIVVEFTPDFG